MQPGLGLTQIAVHSCNEGHPFGKGAAEQGSRATHSHVGQKMHFC